MVVVQVYLAHLLRPHWEDLRVGNGRRVRPLYDRVHAAVRSYLRLCLMTWPNISTMRCQYAKVCMSCKSMCLQHKVRRNVQKPHCTFYFHHPSKNQDRPYPRSALGPATWPSTLLLLAHRLPVRFGVVSLSPCHRPPCFHFPLRPSTSHPPNRHSSPLHP